MGGIDARAVWDLAGTLAGGGGNPSQTVLAEVSRIDEEGTVWVRFPGASSDTPVEISSAEVEPGDSVTVTVDGGKASLAGNASAPATSSRAVDLRVEPAERQAEEAAEEAEAALRAAAEAQEVAEATNQHFWTRSENPDGAGAGAFVTDMTQEEWLDGASRDFDDLTDDKPYVNLLLNSLGGLIRRGKTTLASFTKSAVAFFDGQGVEESNMLATFGASGAQVGKSSGPHVAIKSSGVNMMKGDVSMTEFSDDVRVGKLSDTHSTVKPGSFGIYPAGSNANNDAHFLATSSKSRIGSYDKDHLEIAPSYMVFLPGDKSSKSDAYMAVDSEKIVLHRRTTITEDGIETVSDGCRLSIWNIPGHTSDGKGFGIGAEKGRKEGGLTFFSGTDADYLELYHGNNGITISDENVSSIHSIVASVDEGAVGIGSSASGNHGLYLGSQGKWLVRETDSGKVFVNDMDFSSANAAARALGTAKTAGDSWTMNGYYADGFLTNSRKRICLTVALPFRLYGFSSCTLRGTVTVRQNGSYLWGSDSSTAVNINSGVRSYTATAYANGYVNIFLNTTTEQTSAVNNDTVAVHFNTLTVTLA